MVRYLDHLQEENFIKAYYQLSPFTITPTNIFADYSKECAAWWYVGRRATARGAEKLAGYVSKGLRTALEAVPSITTKIRCYDSRLVLYFSMSTFTMFYLLLSRSASFGDM